MDCTENISSIIVSSLVAGETCPRSCSLAAAVLLSPVYTAVTWQRGLHTTIFTIKTQQV
jgi:hypothetical protein